MGRNQGFSTDQGYKPLKNIVGVVENGIFAKRRADVVLLGNEASVEKV